MLDLRVCRINLLIFLYSPKTRNEAGWCGGKSVSITSERLRVRIRVLAMKFFDLKFGSFTVASSSVGTWHLAESLD